jgi:hypothetical protein
MADQCILAAQDYGDKVFRGEETARVHSVFDHSFTLQMPDSRLINVSLRRRAEHARMVGIDQMGGAVQEVLSELSIGREFRVSEEHKTFLGGRVRIDCSAAMLVGPGWIRPTQMTPQQRVWVRDALRRAMQAKDLRAWGVPFTRIESQFRASVSTGSVEPLRRLIGLGLGLTPSGDDFLVGLLASTVSLGSPRREALADLLRSGMDATTDATTDMSRDGFRSALQGDFPFALVELANASPAVSQPALERLVSRLCGIGATSGIDTLLGYTMGLQENERAWKPFRSSFRGTIATLLP